MDSHDTPRSIVPARSYSVPQPVGAAAWPSVASHQAMPAANPSPQLIQVTLRALKRYWWLVLGLWIGLTTGACAMIFLKVEPLYESQSLLRVSDKDKIYGADGGSDLETFQQTLVELIRSTNVLTAAANDPAVAGLARIREADDPVLELRNALYVEKIPHSYLISVSMASRDANEAATIVNAVVDAFLKQNMLWTTNLSKDQKETLTTVLEDLTKRSKELDEQWLNLAKKGEVDPQVQIKGTSGPKTSGEKDGEEGQGSKSVTMLTIEEYRRAQEQKRTIQIELATAEANLKYLTERKTDPKVDSKNQRQLDDQVRRVFEMDPDVTTIREAMYKLQEQIQEVRAKGVGSVDPAERKYRNQFDQLRRRYDTLWATKQDPIREQIVNHDGADAQVQIRAAEMKVNDLRARKEIIERDILTLQTNTSNLATDEVRIAMIREERDSISQMRDTVRRKFDDLEYTSKDGSRIRLNTPAAPAGRARSNSRMKYLAMAPVGVLGLVLCLAVALELRSARVYDPESLSLRMRHEVFPIAPLPNLRAGEDNRSIRAEQKLARFVQSLDHLRVALCEGGIPGRGRAVLITSATGGEGKTTLSAHLSARCANAGTSVLLIDADMRRASLGRLLDVVGGPGLADVLNGDVPLAEALRPVQAGGFAFLSAGTTNIDPSRILTTSRLTALVEQLRASYDLVLIDSPPILPVPDALLLGRHVDGVVMASRFDSSRLPQVERACRQLAVAGVPILGMVVNGARGHASNYDSYNYNYSSPSNRVDADETAAG